MDNKNDNSNSENGSYSDSSEMFDDIFSDGMDPDAPDIQKEKPPSPTPPDKAPSPKPVKKVEQRLEPPKGPPTKKATPPASPIKSEPSVELDASLEKQPGSDSENGSFSDSLEMFDNIFSDGMDADVPETKKEKPPVPVPPSKAASPIPVKKVEQRAEPPKVPPTKKAEPSAQQPIKRETPVAQDVSLEKRPAPTPPGKAPSPKPVKKVPPPAPPIKREPSVELDASLGKRPGTDEKFKKQEIEKIEFHEKPKKNLNPFIFISSIVVLVMLSMLAGRVVDYDGIIEYVKTATHLKSDNKTTVRKEDNKNGKASGVISDLKTSSLVTKDEKSKIEDSDIQASQTLKKGTPPVINNGPSEKVVPVQDTNKVISGEDRSNDKASRVSTMPLISGKTTNENADVLNREILLYPYSIYLGSYSTYDAVKKATSDYKEMGLSPYWIKLDLGEKGIWFRLFAGYFQTREEVDKFIKTKQISGAESKKISYVNLIGIYASEEEVNKQKEILEKLGYCPYVISENKKVFRLYVGAFYDKDMAEQQNADLLLKGIRSKVVER